MGRRDFRGEAVLGRRLKELRLGASVGVRPEPLPTVVSACVDGTDSHDGQAFTLGATLHFGSAP